MKINVSYGVLLSTSGRLRYFDASANNATVLPVARRVSNHADLNQLPETFEGHDPAQLGINRRDGLAWVLRSVTNAMFYVYKLLDVNRVRCAKAVELSAHILMFKSILAITKRPSTGKMWDDNLCFFRCLVVEHEWDEASSRLVSVKDTTPSTTGNVLFVLMVAGEERGL